MTFAFADFIRSAGTIAGAVAMLIGCVALVAKLPPTKWVWRRLVSQPLGTSFDTRTRDVVEGALAPIKAQLASNGGSTLRDRVDAIDAKVDAVGERLDTTAEELAESDAALDYRLTAIEHKLGHEGEGA